MITSFVAIKSINQGKYLTAWENVRILKCELTQLSSIELRYE